MGRFGSMPRTRGGIGDTYAGLDAGNGGRRASRGPRGRSQLGLDEATLDEAALDYSRDEFEINEMVLARNSERNEAWWPVSPSTVLSQTKAKVNLVTPTAGSTLLHTFLGPKRKGCGKVHRAGTEFRISVSLWLFWGPHKLSYLQGILLDPRTEVPDHVRKIKQRDKPFCVMFYGPGTQVSYIFRTT